MKIMRKFEKGLELEAECDSNLLTAAEQLLVDLNALHQRGPVLRDGSTILFGWAPLRLRQVGRALRVEEPDFLGGAIQEYVPSVELTLKVLDEQARLLRTLALDRPPRPTLYNDTIIVAKGAFDQCEIYLERQKPVREGDSGWYIGPATGHAPSADELESIYAYQLLLLCPELIPVLALPEGYLATFHHRRLKTITDDNDNRIWPVED